MKKRSEKLNNQNGGDVITKKEAEPVPSVKQDPNPQDAKAATVTSKSSVDDQTLPIGNPPVSTQGDSNLDEYIKSFFVVFVIIINYYRLLHNYVITRC